MNPIIEPLLRVIAEYELHGEVLWYTDMKFFVNCNDLFFWALADGEPIETIQDVEALEQACKVAKYDGSSLYCARRRKMRPQGAFYKHFDKGSWPLFDACGPYRPVTFGNPVDRADEIEAR